VKRKLSPVTKCKNCGARIVFIVDNENLEGNWFHTGCNEDGEFIESNADVGCTAEPINEHLKRRSKSETTTKESDDYAFGYETAKKEQKARDAKLREILEDTAWCLREYVEGFQTDGKGKSTLGMAIGNTKKALLLVEKEVKE